MRRIAISSLCVALLGGCANLQAPKFVESGGVCTKATSKALCLLDRLSANYTQYTNDAQEARMISDMTAIGATGGAIIGAATSAHSDLYKATGGIALTAMGLSNYANFKTQALATRVAASKLTCAKAPLSTLVKMAGQGQQEGLAGASTLIEKKSVPGFTMVPEGTTAVKVMSVVTTIAPTDYLSMANALTSYENATLNIERAKKILAHIDEEATTNLVGLQLSVINDIENDSFKLDQALAVMTPAPPLPFNPSQSAQAAFVGIVPLQMDAVVVIEAYERYTRCLQGKFEPTVF